MLCTPPNSSVATYIEPNSKTKWEAQHETQHTKHAAKNRTRKRLQLEVLPTDKTKNKPRNPLQNTPVIASYFSEMNSD